MPNKIELRTATVSVVGRDEKVELTNDVARELWPDVPEAWGMDEIICNGKRIGTAWHKPESPLMLHRILNQHEMREVIAAVSTQRASQGKPPVKGALMPPDPEKMRQAMEAANDE